MQNIQLQRQLSICHSELQTLKQQIELLQKEKGALEQTIIVLKKQRLISDSQSRKTFQENQKNRQLVQKLKIDNKSMEMQIEKFRAQRKVYYNNLGNIEHLKRDISAQLAQKNALIDETSSKLRKIQRNHSQCRLKIEDLQRAVNQSGLERKQLQDELKVTLEKYLTTNNILTKMEYQLKEANQLNKQLKQRIYELQKQRQQLLLKLGYEANESQGNLSSSKKSNYHIHQRSMLQIQSYMRQIENVLDLKRQQLDRKQKNYDKLKISMDCLQKLL